MPVEPTEDIPLPDGWELATDYDGKSFYIDHNTRQTSWIDPRDRLRKPSSFADCVGDELPVGWEQTRQGASTYFINHISGETQSEDPRQQWRSHQERMLKEYLVTAHEDLQAKQEICTVKEERLRLAQDEFHHLHETVTEWKSTNSLSSSSSRSSTRYDPDLLKADLSLARERVSRLKRELDTSHAQVHYKQRGIHALNMVDQKMCAHAPHYHSQPTMSAPSGVNLHYHSQPAVNLAPNPPQYPDMLHPALRDADPYTVNSYLVSQSMGETPAYGVNHSASNSGVNYGVNHVIPNVNHSVNHSVNYGARLTYGVNQGVPGPPGAPPGLVAPSGLVAPPVSEYDAGQQRQIVERIRAIQHSLSQGQVERDGLLQSLAQLKDDIIRKETGSSPDVSLLNSPHERFSTASQTDLSGEGISTGARLAEIARMRLQYDEAKKTVKSLSQELAEAMERDVPGLNECDKDRLLLMQEKEQLLRELRSINRDGRSGAEIASIQTQISRLEHSIQAAMATSSQQIAERLKVQEHKEVIKRKLDEAVRLTTYLESQLKSLSLSTLSSGSSVGSLGSLSASSRASLNSLTYPDPYSQPRSLDASVHDLSRIYNQISGQVAELESGEDLPPSYEQHISARGAHLLPQIAENAEDATCRSQDPEQCGSKESRDPARWAEAPDPEPSGSTASLPALPRPPMPQLTSSISLPGLPQLGSQSARGSTQSLPQILEHPTSEKLEIPEIVRNELPKLRLMEGSFIQKLTESVDPGWRNKTEIRDENQYYDMTSQCDMMTSQSERLASQSTSLDNTAMAAYHYREDSSSRSGEMTVPFARYASYDMPHSHVPNTAELRTDVIPNTTASSFSPSASYSNAACSSAAAMVDSLMTYPDLEYSPALRPEYPLPGSRPEYSSSQPVSASALIPLITEVDSVPTLQYLDPRTGEVVRSQTIYTVPDHTDTGKVPLSPLSETSSGVDQNLSGGNTRSVSAAVSDESVAGDSGVFDASGKKCDEAEEARPVKTVDCAQVLIRLKYEADTQALSVTVDEARNLLALFPEDNSAVCIKVSLLPASDVSHQFTTSASLNVNSPKFSETYRFSIVERDLYGKTLQANVWCVMDAGSDECLGSVQVSLADFDSAAGLSKWYNVLSFKFMQAETSSGRRQSYDKTPPAPTVSESSRPSSASSVQSRRGNPLVTGLIEESSDESTVVSSQTSTLTRNQAPDELSDFPVVDGAAESDTAGDSTDGEPHEGPCEGRPIERAPGSAPNLAAVVERLAKQTIDEHSEDEDLGSLSPSDEEEAEDVAEKDEVAAASEEVVYQDKETNTDSAFRTRDAENATQASVRRSQTFSPTALRPDTRRCKLNRHGSDSAVPRFRRGPFQRNTVERRTLRRKKSSASLKDTPAAMERHKPAAARMRTSLDLELDLQASETRLELLNDDISRLRQLVTCMRDARDSGDGELPAWFTENEQLQQLIAQAETLWQTEDCEPSVYERKVAKLLRKVNKEARRISTDNKHERHFREKMAFFTSVNMSVPVVFSPEPDTPTGPTAPLTPTPAGPPAPPAGSLGATLEPPYCSCSRTTPTPDDPNPCSHDSTSPVTSQCETVTSQCGTLTSQCETVTSPAQNDCPSMSAQACDDHG